MDTEKSFRGGQLIAVLLMGLSIMLFGMGLRSEVLRRQQLRQLPPKLAQMAKVSAPMVGDQCVLYSTLALLCLGIGSGLQILRANAMDTQVLKRATGRSLAASPAGAASLVAAMTDTFGREWAESRIQEIDDPVVAERFQEYLESEDAHVRITVGRLLQRVGWQPKSDSKKARLLAAVGSFQEAAELGEVALDPLTLEARTGYQRLSAIEQLPKLESAAVSPLLSIYEECLALGDWAGVEVTANSLAMLEAKAASAVRVLSDSRKSPSLALTSAQGDAWRAVDEALQRIQAHLSWAT